MMPNRYQWIRFLPDLGSKVGDSFAIGQLSIEQLGQFNAVNRASQTESFGSFSLPFARRFLRVVVVCGRKIVCCRILVVSLDRRDVEHADPRYA